MDILEYHQRSKHGFGGYAKGPETLDWDSQPNPFRRFVGAPLLHLPLATDKPQHPVDRVFSNQPAVSGAFNIATLSGILEHALALSAWKQAGSSRWSLRCNPSSGNLHPTEAYILMLGMADEDQPQWVDGLYHYRADEHALELRCRFSENSQSPAPQLAIGLSSIPWREAWKYGERAFRYCQHDIGHALASLSFAARLYGWQITTVECLTDEQLAQLLGLTRSADFVEDEAEYPDLLLNLHAGKATKIPDINSLLALANTGEWLGKAEVLDKKHLYHWPIIEQAILASHKSVNTVRADKPDAEDLPLPIVSDCHETASQIIRQRRSAQAFDGVSVMPRQKFVQLLDHLLPRPQLAPWDCWSTTPRIHLVLFIHRVEGIVPGVYALPRTIKGAALLQSQMRDSFLWEVVEDIPEHIPLQGLIYARSEKTIGRLSCQQAIAANGCFSLGMLAEFDNAKIQSQPWRYRQLYWEAGVLGQILYLQAEVSGFRGTGIGCYFDDAVHDVLGLSNDVNTHPVSLQSLYHFTVGSPLMDARIISLPPYAPSRYDR